MSLRATAVVAVLLFAAPELMPWAVAVALLGWIAVELAIMVLRAAR